jgi:signal transduction histidine kinase/ligand-binding sensor domain-containing protein
VNLILNKPLKRGLFSYICLFPLISLKALGIKNACGFYKPSKKAILFLLFALAGLCSRAQTSNLYFDRFTTEKGLPESFVRFITEDKEGYMWMATQNGLVRYDGYRYKVYNLGSARFNNALTTNIQCLYIDQHKNLWASALNNGLFKYDRYTDSFEQFVFPDKRYVQFEIHTTDTLGNIWGVIANDNDEQTLSLFDIRTKKFELFGKKEKGNNYINATHFFPVVKAASGTIWIPTNNGFYRYNGQGKVFTGYFTSTDTAKQVGVNPLYEAPSSPGVFWLNTFHGHNVNLKLVSWDSKTSKATEYKPGNAPFNINSVGIFDFHEDKNKGFWVATDKGLSKLDRATGKFTNYIPKDTIRDAKKNNLSAFTEAKEGSFWLSSSAGLVHFDPVTGNFNRYVPDADKPGAINKGAFIAAKYIDHTGILWVGHAWGGANKVNKLISAFTIIKKEDGKPGGYPGKRIALTPLADGSCLADNQEYVYQWTPGATEFKKIFAKPKDEHTHALITAKDGLVYLGSDKGLRVYDPVKHNSVQYVYNPADSTSICSNDIARIFQDHAGIIWIGSDDKGMCSFDPVTKKFTRYAYRSDGALTTAKNNGRLDDRTVETIYEDRDNNLWVGTNFGSLNRFDKNIHRFISYYSAANQAMVCVSSIMEDNKGRFWVGTYLKGIFEFDRKKGTYIRHFDETSGLLFNSVFSTQEDNQGNIWVYSGRGLSRINGETLAIKNFKTSDILPGYEAYEYDAFQKLKNGLFAMSLTNGIAVFNPKGLDSNPFGPRVVIENILFSNPLSNQQDVKNVIAYGHKQIDIAYNQNRIQFNYVGLQYDNPAQNRYAYKLDGYDSQWVQAGVSRSVTYTNLSPGAYTFHVIAANSSGVWNYQGASITVVIASPWWVRWWAWLLYAAAFAWALSAFIAYRSKKLKEENRLLEEKVSLRTKQLSEQQEEIIAQRDQLSSANDELSEKQEEIITQRDQLAVSLTQLKNTQRQLIQSEKLASLGELTAGIAHEIQNPLNFVNNFSELSIELIADLKEEVNNGDKAEASAIADNLVENLEKINHHGRRADSIVKGMLEHSRAGNRQKEPADINKIADEYLRLSYHGLRAKDKTFNSELYTQFQSDLPKIDVVAHDIGRVLLNLYNNSFYAVQQGEKTKGATFKPKVSVTTAFIEGNVLIKVTDNGNGIPEAIRDKIMQPFFTTKPTGEGTGLGLSLSYDIVVNGHGGKIEVNSKTGEFTEFTISLPA